MIKKTGIFLRNLFEAIFCKHTLYNWVCLCFEKYFRVVSVYLIGLLAKIANNIREFRRLWWIIPRYVTPELWARVVEYGLLPLGETKLCSQHVLCWSPGHYRIFLLIDRHLESSFLLLFSLDQQRHHPLNNCISSWCSMIFFFFFCNFKWKRKVSCSWINNSRTTNI